MGNRVELTPYAKMHIEKMTGEKIYEYLKNFSLKNGYLEGRLPATRMSHYDLLKSCIEYKWFIPMPVPEKGRLKFSKYSTGKLLAKMRDYYPKTRLPRIDYLVSNNYRNKVRLYAAGAIEKAPDNGESYRKQLKEQFESTQVRLIDPLDFQYNKNFKSLSEFRRRKGAKRGYKFARKVVKGDIEAVSCCDAMVVNIDKYIGAGSISEATIALSYGMPIYGVITDKNVDFYNINVWLMGCVHRFFYSIQDFREFVIRT